MLSLLGQPSELCKTFPEAPDATGLQSAENDPEMLAHWARLEAAGLPARFRIDPAGRFRATRTPLLSGVESYILSGKRAVRQNLSDDVSTGRIGSLMLYHRLHSPAYEPGAYSTIHEGGVVQFVDWYVHMIEPRLAGGVTGESRRPLSLAS